MITELANNENFVLASMGNIITLFWRNPTVESIDRLPPLLKTFGEAHPTGFAVLTLVAEHSPPPSPEARSRMAKMMGEGGALKAVAVCFEGSGVRAIVVRSVVTGLSLLARPTYAYKVFSTPEEALSFLSDALAKAGAPAVPAHQLLAAFLPWRRRTPLSP